MEDLASVLDRVLKNFGLVLRQFAPVAFGVGVAWYQRPNALQDLINATGGWPLVMVLGAVLGITVYNLWRGFLHWYYLIIVCFGKHLESREFVKANLSMWERRNVSDHVQAHLQDELDKWADGLYFLYCSALCSLLVPWLVLSTIGATVNWTLSWAVFAVLFVVASSGNVLYAAHNLAVGHRPK